MIEQFLQYIQYEKNSSSCTVLSYRKDLTAFAQFVADHFPATDVVRADTDCVRLWLMSQREAGLSAATINRRLSALRTFYKYLLRHNIVTSDPTLRIVAAKTPKKIPTFFREKEMDKLLSVSENLSNFEACRDETIIETFYQTGIRLAELIGIKDTDIDFDRNTIRIFGKRRKERIIPFGNGLKQKITQYIVARDKEVERTTPYLYVLRSGRQMYPQAVYRIVKAAMSQVSTQGKRSPHVLRHTFATAMLNNGADINAVKELLGHASLAATQIYTHTTFEQLQKIYGQAHPRAKNK